MGRLGGRCTTALTPALSLREGEGATGTLAPEGGEGRVRGRDQTPDPLTPGGGEGRISS